MSRKVWKDMAATKTTGLEGGGSWHCLLLYWIYFHKHVLVFVPCDNVFLLKDGTNVKTSKRYSYCSVSGFCLRRELSGLSNTRAPLSKSSRATDEPNPRPFWRLCSAWAWGSRVPRGTCESCKPSWPFAAVRPDVWRGNWQVSLHFMAVLDWNTTSWSPFQWTLNFLISHTPLFYNP